MGCFSFLDCVNGEHTLADDTVCILVPEEMREKVRKYLYPDLLENIWENRYGLYGRFDGVDVYEYLAFVNLFELTAAEQDALIALLPQLNEEDFGGLSDYEIMGMKESDYSDEEIEKLDKERRAKYYQRHLAERNWVIRSIRNYKPGMKDARELGIYMYFNIPHEKLKYPLKITHCNDVCYEEVNGYSEDDPGQGLWY